MITDSYSVLPVQRRTRRRRRTSRIETRVLEAITLETVQLGETVIQFARGEQAYLREVGGQRFWIHGPIVYRAVEAIDDVEQPKVWNPKPSYFGGNFLLCHQANADDGFECPGCHFTVPFLRGGVTGPLMCKECLATEGAESRIVTVASSIVLVAHGRRYRLSAEPTLRPPSTRHVEIDQAIAGHG